MDEKVGGLKNQTQGGVVIRIFVLAFGLIVSNHVFSYVDLGVNYSYNQQIIDADKNLSGEAVSVTKTISAYWSWYIWEYTALEFSYSRSDNNMTDNRPIQDDSASFVIKEVENKVTTEVQGIGLRQSFANRKARFIPSLGLGYARVVERGITHYTVNTGGADQRLTQENEEEVYSSSYMTVSFRIRLTELMGITVGAKTVVPEFDLSDAEKNLTYNAGFSWIF